MQTNTTAQRSPGSTIRTNLVLDIGLLVVFLLMYERRGTGASLHEWLGVAMSSMLIIHILLHWEWVVAVTRRFFGTTSRQARLNSVLDRMLFIALTTTLVSGLMVSESILPLVGLQAVGGRFWHWLHTFAADGVFWLVAVHIALHWQWLANAIQRHMIAPLRQRTGRGAGQPATEMEEQQAT